MSEILQLDGMPVTISILVLCLFGVSIFSRSAIRGSIKWWIGLQLWFGIIGAIGAFIRTGKASSMLLGAIFFALTASLLLGGQMVYHKLFRNSDLDNTK